jgi:hypothetical protein
MMSERANIFENGGIALDLAEFTPQPPKERMAPEKVREVAERSQFKSREPEQKRSRHQRRQYRTGRDTHFSMKADAQVIDDFYAIAESQGWVMGETLEHAVQALKKQLDGPKGKN